MSQSLHPRPVSPSEITLINHQYLSAGGKTDPTMVWGTDVDAEKLCAFVQQCNRSAETLISLAHVLVRGVALSLARHRQLNCRIIRGRIFRFREVNVRMICYDRRTADVDILLVRQADRASVEAISRFVWESQFAIASGGHSDCFDKSLLNWGPAWSRRWGSRIFWWLDRNFRLPRLGRIDRHLDSAVIVNYLGFPDAPPMRMYKPSKFPDESSLLSVTMGRIESRPVAVGNQVEVRPTIPLFIRADHRVTDAYLLSRFIGTLRSYLQNPHLMETRRDGVRATRQQAA